MLRDWLLPIEDMPRWQFCWRMAWLALQIVVTYYFLTRDDPFFYQGF